MAAHVHRRGDALLRRGRFSRSLADHRPAKVSAGFLTPRLTFPLAASCAAGLLGDGRPQDVHDSPNSGLPGGKSGPADGYAKGASIEEEEEE